MAGIVCAVMACAGIIATGGNASTHVHAQQARNTTHDRLPSDVGGRDDRPLPEFIPDASFYVSPGLYLHARCLHVMVYNYTRVGDCCLDRFNGLALVLHWARWDVWGCNRVTLVSASCTCVSGTPHTGSCMCQCVAGQGRSAGEPLAVCSTHTRPCMSVEMMSLCSISNQRSGVFCTPRCSHF